MSSDEHQNIAIPVGEFEGEFIRSFEGKLPALTLDMPEGYRRGTHLKLEVEVRIRNVDFIEGKSRNGERGDLSRNHVFALEEIRLADAWDPATRPSNVGGNVAGSAWEEAFLDFVHGDTDELDFDGELVPQRVQDMVKAYWDAFGGVSTPVGTEPVESESVEFDPEF